MSVHGLTSDTYRSMPAGRARRRSRDDRRRVRPPRPGGPRGPQAVPLDDNRVRSSGAATAPDDLPAPGRFEPGGIRPWDGFAEREAPTRVESLQVAADHG
jgi:hypothetical protein